jgi:hypothetical protein
VTPTPTDSWEFWQRSQRALDKLNATMQVMATAIAQDDPALQVPPHVAKDVRQAIARFEQNFELLVHAQKKLCK